MQQTAAQGLRRHRRIRVLQPATIPRLRIGQPGEPVEQRRPQHDRGADPLRRSSALRGNSSLAMPQGKQDRQGGDHSNGRPQRSLRPLCTSAATAVRAAGPELRPRQRREPYECGGQIGEGHAATIADPGFPGAQIAVHVRTSSSSDALPGLQFDQAIQQLVEIVQTAVAGGAAGPSSRFLTTRIASSRARVRQTRQLAHQPRTFARAGRAQTSHAHWRDRQ